MFSVYIGRFVLSNLTRLSVAFLPGLSYRPSVFRSLNIYRRILETTDNAERYQSEEAHLLYH